MPNETGQETYKEAQVRAKAEAAKAAKAKAARAAKKAKETSE